MISQSIQDALNKQIAEDHRSSRLYLSMAAHCEGATLTGFGRRFRKQGHEKFERAEKIVKYMTRLGGHVELGSADAPPSTWPSPLAVVEDAHEREQYASGCIHDLVNLAGSEGDNATRCLVQEFVLEQSQVEASAARLVEQVKRMGDTPTGVFLLDRTLA